MCCWLLLNRWFNNNKKGEDDVVNLESSKESTPIVNNDTTNNATTNTNSMNMKQLQSIFPRGKKGIGLTLKPMGEKNSWVKNLTKVVELRPSWNYTWGHTSLYDLQPPMIDFVPMIWGYSDENNTKNNKNAKLLQQLRVIKSLNPNAFFTFNEPDGQSNVSVEQAIEVWPLIESINIPIVSPSCIHPNTEWMKEFMKLIEQNNHRVDIIGVHTYPGPNVKQFQQYMISIYESYNHRPIIITEFAIADWKAKTAKENKYTTKQVLHFMKQILPWLEQQDWILGYAWFPFRIDDPHGTSSALFETDGKLTSCGEYYSKFKTRKQSSRLLESSSSQQRKNQQQQLPPKSSKRPFNYKKFRSIKPTL